MKIRIVHVIWIIGLMFYLPGLAQAHALKNEEVWSKVYLTKEQALKNAFPDGEEIVPQKFWTDQKQRKFITDIIGEPFNKSRIKIYVGKKMEKTTGLAIFDQIINPGHNPIQFQYMAVFQPDGKIRKVVMLEYRGLQRDEIVSEKFLSQFNGKNIDSDFKTVNSKQGMTIPVQVLTHGALKLAAICHTYLASLKN
jgi:hypothetical protein